MSEIEQLRRDLGRFVTSYVRHWTAVATKMPASKDSRTMLVTQRGTHVTLAWWHGDGSWYYDDNSEPPTRMEDVTHWMELPDPPRADDLGGSN